MNSIAFRIHSKQFGELRFSNAIPACLEEYILPDTKARSASFPAGHMLSQEFAGDGLSFNHLTIILDHADSLRITARYPVCSLTFCLQNSFQLFGQNMSNQISIYEGQYNMFFFPDMDVTADFKQAKPYSILALSFSSSILQKMGTAYPILAAFLKAIDTNRDTSLYSANQFATKEMKKIIFRLLNDECKDQETSFFIKKGRSLEILSKVVDNLPDYAMATTSKLNKQDTDKIIEARSILDQNFTRYVTLYELSRKVGLNVHKLSLGFHQITGNTIFHYQRKHRMAKAIQLLKETDRDLFDIGTEVGYIDGKTFSKEFKKEKGVSPLEFRKQIRCQAR